MRSILSLTRVAPSKRMGLPVPYIGERSYYPHDFLLQLIRFRNWDIRRRNRRYVFRHAGDSFVTDERTGDFVVYEYYRMWERFYAPFDLHGRVVLDAGAACGETVHFFLQHGASRVIAVESDPGRAGLLRSNAATNGWPVEILVGPFDNSMLGLGIDFLKMDIEGGEEQLLALDFLPPSIIETHSRELTQALVAKFRGNVVFSYPDGVSLVKTV